MNRATTGVAGAGLPAGAAASLARRGLYLLLWSYFSESFSRFFPAPVRSRLNEKFARGAENQAVESVSAIETVKSLAVEPQMAGHRDRQLAAYVAP